MTPLIDSRDLDTHHPVAFSLLQNRRLTSLVLSAATSAAFLLAPLLAQAQANPRSPLGTTVSTASGTPATPAQHRLAPRISGFDVRQVPQLQAGAELDFSLWGTPGAAGQIRIDGAQRAVVLSEVADGVYQGTHVVSSRDRIAPNARVTGTLRQGNLVTTATLDEPLQQGFSASAPTPSNPVNSPGAAGQPQISSVTIRAAVPNAAPNSPQANLVLFTVVGTPSGRATVSVPNVSPTVILLDEVRPGEYTAVHALRNTDNVNPSLPVTARVTLNNRTATQTAARAWNEVRLPAYEAACLDCGKVLAINEVQVDGENPSIVGTVAGGAVGGLLGTQVGQGRGRDLATVAGALGGALAGREIERRRNQTVRYEVVLGMENGQQQTVVYPTRPAVAVGDSVRLVDGQLHMR